MIAVITLVVVLMLLALVVGVLGATSEESASYGQVEPNKSVPVPVREPINGRGDEGEKPGRYL